MSIKILRAALLLQWNLFRPTRIADNGGKVFKEQGPQKRRHGARDPEGSYDNAVILRVVHMVVVHRRHHVVGHHLTENDLHVCDRNRFTCLRQNQFT